MVVLGWGHGGDTGTELRTATWDGVGHGAVLGGCTGVSPAWGQCGVRELGVPRRVLAMCPIPLPHGKTRVWGAKGAALAGRGEVPEG